MRAAAILFLSITCFAAPQIAEKEAFEQRLVKRIQKSLSPFLNPDEYVVDVTATFREVVGEEEIVEEDKGVLALSKLGMSIDRNVVMKKFFQKEESLFDRLESVDVAVMIPDTAREELEKDVRPIINRVAKAYAPLEFNVSLSRFNSIKPPPPEKPKKTPLDYLVIFQIPIAMIAVSVILFLLVLLYMRKYGKLEGEKLEVMRTQTAAAAAPAAAVDGVAAAAPMAASGGASVVAAGGAQVAGTVSGSVSGVAGGATVVSSGSVSASAAPVAAAMPPPQMDRLLGFTQFGDMLESSPFKAARLVKEWINLKSYPSLLALSVIPQHFGTEKIQPLLEELDQELRMEWKGCIQKSLPDNAYMIVNQFILSETVENVLVPPEPTADELKGMLLDIKPEEATKLAIENIEFGAIFANLFEPSRVAQMFASMDSNLVERVSVASLEFTPSRASELREDLKEAIAQVRGDREDRKSHFLERSVDLIKEVGPEKEIEIYRALAKAGEKEAVRRAAEKIVPASLIGELPAELLKKRLSLMPLTERAVLIASLDEGVRNRFLDSFGEEGRLRDLITVQLEQIQSDPAMVRKIERQRDKIWLEFVGSTRDLIEGNEDWKDQVFPELDKWVDRLTGTADNVA